MSVKASIWALSAAALLLAFALAGPGCGAPGPEQRQALTAGRLPGTSQSLLGPRPTRPLESRLNFVTSKRAVVNREMNLQVQIHRGEAPFETWDWAEAKGDWNEYSPEGEPLALLRFVKLDIVNAGDFKVTPLDNLAEARDLSQQDLLKWSFIVVPLKAGECRLWIKVLTGPTRDPFASRWDTVKVYKVKVVPDESWMRRAQRAVEEMTGLMKALSALLAAAASVLGYLGIKTLRKRRGKGAKGPKP